MKKVIALILCAALLIPVAVVPASAATVQNDAAAPVVKTADSLESAFAEGENSIILFVTGIGQSFSYLFDESYTADGAFENGTLQDYENYAPLIAERKYSGRWNLFSNEIGAALKQKSSIKAILKVVGGLILSIFTRKNMVKDADVRTLITNMFSYNIVDENGKCDSRVVTPRYTMPVSEYPGVYDADGNFDSEAKGRFYGSIPCAEIAEKRLGANYEDYLYCYNYCAFSYTSQNVKGLHDFIETVLADNKVGAKDVVLVPMSMGASVVSAYLAAYPQQADNHVRRVVSIVGCWNGSDVVTDLLKKDYADNSADLFYNGIIGDLVGEPWGYVVNVLLRVFPKAGLRGFIDQAVGILCETVFLDAPSLLALIPDYSYDEIRPMIKSEAVLKEADAYHAAQSTLKQRLADLDAQGIPVSFIAGYGLPYGAVTSDYKVFGFMKHAELTNSDEIINISSTAPGTSFVAYNKTFADGEGRRLSPDKTIDLSTTYYPDRTWFFYGQKHELEYNNTAIATAIDIALGKVKSIADCDDLAEDGVYYPQFNLARNLKSLKRSWIPDLNRYCENTGYVLTAEQQALYAEVIAMTESTVNNPEADNALLDRFHDMLVDIGVYTADAEPSKASKVLTDILKKNNDIIYKLFGAKGFGDLDLASAGN